MDTELLGPGWKLVDSHLGLIALMWGIRLHTWVRCVGYDTHCQSEARLMVDRPSRQKIPQINYR